ncbi:MAG: dienelactone hydrolase family protein [Gammaproteobacteria bacterium]|nr:dienelactone hydrolase family protein [Gammaproteobacteria bacterium]
MFIVKFRKSGPLAALVACSFLLGACGKPAEPVDEAELAAGRENVDAMSREHAQDTTDPSPAAEVEPARAVVSDPRMPYAEVGDELVYGYFAAPSDVFEPLPAVIVIHEWWGLNDNVRAMADRLAGEGYMVLAVDLYGGKTAESPEHARQLMLQVVEDPSLAEENLRSAYAFLETAGAPRIGSLGWCFGGGWSLNTAQLFPEVLDAAVIYYGQVTADEDRLAPLDVPILGLFGGEDTGIKVESVDAFRVALERLGKEHEVHIYPGVGHAFANPTGRNYNAEAASDAWEKTLEFLARHLGEGDSAATS